MLLGALISPRSTSTETADFRPTAAPDTVVQWQRRPTSLRRRSPLPGSHRDPSRFSDHASDRAHERVAEVRGQQTGRDASEIERRSRARKTKPAGDSGQVRQHTTPTSRAEAEVAADDRRGRGGPAPSRRRRTRQRSRPATQRRRADRDVRARAAQQGSPSKAAPTAAAVRRAVPAAADGRRPAGVAATATPVSAGVVSADHATECPARSRPLALGGPYPGADRQPVAVGDRSADASAQSFASMVTARKAPTAGRPAGRQSAAPVVEPTSGRPPRARSQPPLPRRRHRSRGRQLRPQPPTRPRSLMAPATVAHLTDHPGRRDRRSAGDCRRNGG